MNLETVVLGFLNDESLTGYDISKKIDISVGFFWHATHPQVYTSLKSLEAKGFAVSRHEFQSTGPSKNIYTITAEGKQELLKNLAEIIPPQEGKFPLLVTMFFGAELGRQFWIDTIEAQIREQQDKLSIYESIKEQIQTETATETFAGYLRKRTVEFGIGYQKHFINWLNDTIEELKS